MSQFDNSTHTFSLRKVLSIAVPCSFGWACTYFSTDILRAYSYGLFLWLPFVIGATSTLMYGHKKQEPDKKIRNNAYLTLLIFCIGLLIFAWEGIICLIMAAPIGLLLTYLGYLVARIFLPNMSNNGTRAAGTLLLLSVPALMAFEGKAVKDDDLRSVTSSVKINATPEKVWDNVIAFPRLGEPTELIFKTGIAYPIDATIKGSGVGAVRRCNFSTGSFVEPITVWDEPRLLKFSVEEQPASMKEVSFYDVRPNHLHGYWISKEGQFKLTKLPDGHTLLEGTTWYVNKIRPGFYWTMWSDFIVHKIHNRVLQHIKEQVEVQEEYKK
ncbi:hypothetical protein [Dyadobacter sp. 22481]|uniref:hypothetical protein n=1 Tax=Dyadobacter sp. 22481 TaxID=3453926 RepID=UPI003F872EC6